MTREREQDAAITRLREGLRTQSQRDEAALLRDWIKARRIRARRGLKAVGAAAPDRPALVACGQKAAGGAHLEGNRDASGESPARRRITERRPK